MASTKSRPLRTSSRARWRKLVPQSGGNEEGPLRRPFLRRHFLVLGHPTEPPAAPDGALGAFGGASCATASALSGVGTDGPWRDVGGGDRPLALRALRSTVLFRGEAFGDITRATLMHRRAMPGRAASGGSSASSPELEVAPAARNASATFGAAPGGLCRTRRRRRGPRGNDDAGAPAGAIVHGGKATYAVRRPSARSLRAPLAAGARRSIFRARKAALTLLVLLPEPSDLGDHIGHAGSSRTARTAPLAFTPPLGAS